MRSKVTPREVGVGLKQIREFSKRRWGWRLAWRRSTEKKEASHLLGLRGRRQYSDQRSNRIRAPDVVVGFLDSDKIHWMKWSSSAFLAQKS